jgi:hypothetical protein
MAWTMIAVASWPFWVVLFIWLCCEWNCIRHENNIAAFLTLTVALLFLTLLTDAKLDWLWWCLNNFGLILLLIVAYVALGAAWAPIEFVYFYGRRKADEFEEKRDSLLSAFKKDPKIWGEHTHDWITVLTFKEFVALKGYPPHIRNYKARFFMVASWWWISAIDCLTFKLVRRVWDAIYYAVGDWCQGLVEKYFYKRFEKLFKDKTEEKGDTTV